VTPVDWMSLSPDATLKSADKIRRRTLGREDSRNGLAMLRDQLALLFRVSAGLFI